MSDAIKTPVFACHDTYHDTWSLVDASNNTLANFWYMEEDSHRRVELEDSKQTAADIVAAINEAASLRAENAKLRQSATTIERHATSIEQLLDRLEAAAVELTPYPPGYRPSAWEAAGDLPWELRKVRADNAKLREQVAELEAQGGPVSEKRITLDELLEVLAKWKAVASGKTCVSFENLSYGASSLWHQTHRENFRKVDRRPEDLSRWVLSYAGFVNDDFPEQVLGILGDLRANRDRLGEACEAARRELNCLIGQAAQRGYTSGGLMDVVLKLDAALKGTP